MLPFVDMEYSAFNYTYSWLGPDTKKGTKQPLSSVCCLCDGCAGHGVYCSYFSLQGDRYRQCGCGTQFSCCATTGMCQSCVTRLEVLKLKYSALYI